MLDEIFDIIVQERNFVYEKFMDSLKEKQKVALYGAGGIGNITYDILKKNGNEIYCFIDDNKEKWGKNIDGIEIKSLKDICKDEEIIIIICIPNPMDIYEKLKSKGYKEVYYFPIMMIERDFYDLSLLLKERD